MQARPLLLRTCFGALVLASAGADSHAQAGTVSDFRKISTTSGGFQGTLDTLDFFGFAVASIGDLNGDGDEDLAVAALQDDDGGSARGAVYVLFLDGDGAVLAEQKISSTSGGLTAVLSDGDFFGSALAGPGDLDGDSLPDLLVGAMSDNDGSTDAGAVYVLYLNADGTVKTHAKISDTQGGLGGALFAFDNFGSALALPGDVDGDGIDDWAVGVRGIDSFSNTVAGAVWVLFMNADETVRMFQRIKAVDGGFDPSTTSALLFGDALTAPGDLNGDGVPDLIAGAAGDSITATFAGAISVLFLNADGTLASTSVIRSGESGFGGVLSLGDFFGTSCEALGDVNGDGVADVAVGAIQDSTGVSQGGAVWILFLDAAGQVSGWQKINSAEGGFLGQLDATDYLGASLALMSGPTGKRVASGATRDDDGGFELGAVWLFDLCDSDPVADFAPSATQGGTPFSVTFTDLSSGSGLSAWAWSFGDGGTSSAQSPTYVYNLPGTYTVALTVSGSDGSCTTNRKDLILVEASASTSIRNGSGINPVIFSSTSLPILGTTWSSEIDGGAIGASGLAFVFGYSAPLAGLPTAFGELLIDPTSDFILSNFGILVAGTAFFSEAVPNDLSLEGFVFSTQGFVNAPGVLTNALDVVLGF